jgi:RNA polymerase sigma-70 factor, ECF subfamily
VSGEPAEHQTPDDAVLVDRARRGDVAAFEQLVRQHRDRAYGVALRICRDRDDADDVTQDAIVRAWRALPDFRGDARFSTWLYRIVTNLALNRVTRARERPSDTLPETATGAIDDPARRTVEADRLAVVLAAMERLTPEQRACLVLREVEGLSYDELAVVLDTTVTAVKGRLFRARQDLAQVLARYDDEVGDEEGRP